jgi:nitrogenase cofactor biosynthesis protein NifB
MGVVMAFYGLAKAMNLLHGSQGCGTYIRRHMATHFNEPIDIATSSLSEEGAVFGGEKNLVKGLKNLIKLYKPEIIGVSTTCLAETIGEDLPGSLRKFEAENLGLGVKLIPVNAPGYGGTHFEGYWHGLKAILAGLDLDPRPHGGLNVIVGPVSPADVRYLKDLLNQIVPNHTLFPDISDNLDGAFNPVYDRLPQKGTAVSAIEKMAGASATIELSLFAPPDESPGLYLEKNFGVKLIKLAPPVGLTLGDAFFSALRELGFAIPARVLEERGRLMDAMADSHKYAALGRAGVFGDPDFVHSISSLAAENGLPTLLAATGSKSSAFRLGVQRDLKNFAILPLDGDPVAADSADFALIEELCDKLKVNLLIGSSEGRRLAQKKGLPLVRRSFPIHDHVGGQRLTTFGYAASSLLLDQMVNKLISADEESFRERLKLEHFRPADGASLPAGRADFGDHGNRSDFEDQGPNFLAPKTGVSQVGDLQKWIPTSPSSTKEPNLAPWGLPDGAALAKANLETIHPCFNLEAARDLARIHLPIASGCNVSCAYCRRDNDCPNESRPGVTSKLLSPQKALERFLAAKKLLPNLKVVGFAGPGESLNSPGALFETIGLIRKVDDKTALCLSTNGLALPFYASELGRLGLRHLTVTVNAVSLEAAKKIYAWADYFGKRFTGEEAAKLILENQIAGVKAAKALGLKVKVNTVLIRGVNDHEAPLIAKKMSELGADLFNLMPHLPVSGTPLGHLKAPDHETIRNLRYLCGAHLPQMTHCQQCRADAAGLLGRDLAFDDQNGLAGADSPGELSGAGQDELEKTPGFFKIALVSKGGVMVDSHFGQAQRVYEYLSNGESLRLLGIREVGLKGGGCDCAMKKGAKSQDRPKGFIEKLVFDLRDVDAVVALRIGESPKELFKKYGIKCFTTMDSLERAARAAAKRLLGDQTVSYGAQDGANDLALA